MSMAWFEIVGIWLASIVPLVALFVSQSSANKRRTDQGFRDAAIAREKIKDEMHQLSAECVRQDALNSLKTEMHGMVRDLKRGQEHMGERMHQMELKIIERISACSVLKPPTRKSK